MCVIIQRPIRIKSNVLFWSRAINPLCIILHEMSAKYKSGNQSTISLQQNKSSQRCHRPKRAAKAFVAMFYRSIQDFYLFLLLYGFWKRTEQKNNARINSLLKAECLISWLYLENLLIYLRTNYIATKVLTGLCEKLFLLLGGQWQC